ncbi:hypothetical protein RRG08_007962 [Elysia crispata]|uniref:Uncharacterized protein n=1 Tax=Elysia crispata TaxID=231223 RepID=A0AAE1DKT9_9GAST|nr:hypothetical protein RRG08_007962 [Elysia crispata]
MCSIGFRHTFRCATLPNILDLLKIPHGRDITGFAVCSAVCLGEDLHSKVIPTRMKLKLLHFLKLRVKRYSKVIQKKEQKNGCNGKNKDQKEGKEE